VTLSGKSFPHGAPSGVTRDAEPVGHKGLAAAYGIATTSAKHQAATFTGRPEGGYRSAKLIIIERAELGA
jgi:hypothetical protein